MVAPAPFAVYARCRRLGALLGIDYRDAQGLVTDTLGYQWRIVEHTVHELAHAACLGLDLLDAVERQVIFTAHTTEGFRVKYTALSTHIACRLSGRSDEQRHELRTLAIEHLVLCKLGLPEATSIYLIAQIAREQDVVYCEYSPAELARACDEIPAAAGVLRTVAARRRSREIAVQLVATVSEPAFETKCRQVAALAWSASGQTPQSVARRGARRSR